MTKMISEIEIKPFYKIYMYWIENSVDLNLSLEFPTNIHIRKMKRRSQLRSIYTNLKCSIQANGDAFKKITH